MLSQLYSFGRVKFCVRYFFYRWSSYLFLLFLLPAFGVCAQDVLWGLTSQGGPQDGGTAFSITSSGGNYQLRHTFGPAIKEPTGSLVQGNDGAFYGMTLRGGTDDVGTIFKIKADGTGFTVLKSIDSTYSEYYDVQTRAMGSLIQGSDGTFYGVIRKFFGANASSGHLFKINGDGTGYNELASFADSPTGGVIEGSDGALYGMTTEGSLYPYGNIYKINRDGSGYTILHTVDIFLSGDLTQGADGALYGFTGPGSEGKSSLFRLQTDGSGYTILRTLDYFTDGQSPQGSLFQGSDGFLYGTASEGGLNKGGTIFRMRPDGTEFSVIRHLSTADGVYPEDGLTEGADGFFYGFTKWGGAYNRGTFYQIRSDGSNFSVLKHFDQASGIHPTGRPVFEKASESCLATGTILREYWAKVNGNQTINVPVNKAPTSSSYLTSFEGPTKVGENYASRIRGYLCAPETGNYTFWIASDDYGDLYLSSDDNPANKQLIAWIKGWSNPRQWNKHYSQKSALIHLKKGKRYYIEALHKQAWVNDNLAVAWRLPSSAASASPVVIPGSVLSPFVPANARMVTVDEIETTGQHLLAYPNPSSGKVRISFSAIEAGPVSVELYDMRGVRLGQLYQRWMVGGEEGETEVNGNAFPAGLYLLQLRSGSHSEYQKLMIQK